MVRHPGLIAKSYQQLPELKHCLLGLFKKNFFFKCNPSPQQIVWLVMETPHTKFQLIRFTGRGGDAI